MRGKARSCWSLGVVALVACRATTDPAASDARVSLAAGGSKVASATGSGQFTYADGWRTFAFNAQRSADGTVTGQMQIDNRAQDRKSHSAVQCVGTFGPRAFVGVQVTTSDDPAVVGLYGIVGVIDNGEGAGAPPDRVSLLNFTSQAVMNAWCAGAYPITALALYDVEGGNIQVR